MTEIRTVLSRLGDCPVLGTVVVLRAVRVQAFAGGESRLEDPVCSHREQCLAKCGEAPAEVDCPLRQLS